MRQRGLILVLLVLTVSTALAVTPHFWENFTQDDLLAGTFERVSLSWDGRLFLAPAYDLYYDTGQPYIFSMVRDETGNIYVGTGHEGKVFRIDPQGQGSLYFQSKELDIYALALDSAGNLFVGTSPDGKVYKVTGPNQGTEFCNPEDKYIWSLLFDDAGLLYVGTGGKGMIVKVSKNGEKTTFYDPDDSNVTALATGKAGNLLAGTSPAGIVIRVNPQGKAYTLLDTSMEEIRALQVDRFGTTYAVASSSKASSSAISTPNLTSQITAAGALPIATIQALSNISSSSDDTQITVSAPGGEKDSDGAKSAIYAISADGSTETVYNSEDSMVYDILVRGDDSLVAATGKNGRLLSINPTKQVTVITDSPEEQITRLAAAGEELFAAGSNQGKVYRLGKVTSQSGVFESKVLDAKVVSSWGKISWRFLNRSGGIVEISTRTGNTEKPDNSWSEWSTAYTTASGQQITNPKARYLQWRAMLKGSAAVASADDALERIHIPYQQENLRPQVVSITLLSPGIALQKPPALPTSTLSISTTLSNSGQALNSPRMRGRDTNTLTPRQVVEPGAQSFTWKTTDANDDDLSYSIYFRGEGESDWKLMKKELTDTFYTLDSTSLPDGVYTLKIVASDEPSNAFGKFLIGELVSRPFVISNTTPSVRIASHTVQGKRVELQFSASVPTGRIVSGEFSIDGGEWFLVFPNDGIADSGQEEFTFATADLAIGEHMIGVRASDGNGNTGTAKLLVKVE